MESHNFKYKTVQKKLCFHIIKRIYRRCKEQYYFKHIKICCVKGIVVDGNHRYIAYLLAGIDFDVIPYTSSHCDCPTDYKDLSLDLDDDWDNNHPDTKFLVTDGDWLLGFRRN